MPQRRARGLTAGYERESLLAGPLALFPAGVRAALRHASDHRFPGFGAAATVRAGGAVTLAVAPQDRAHVGFLFDRRAWRHAERGYRVADGTAAVRLHGCTTPSTQYQGGFVVDSPRCATLEAWVDGTPAPLRHVLSFGAGACPAA